MITSNKFKFAVEVGAGDRASSILAKNSWFIDGHHPYKADKSILIEPNPILFKDLTVFLTPLRDFRVINTAFSNKTGWSKLLLFGYCSYLVGKPSFLNLSCEADAENFWDGISYDVYTQKFSSFDNGEIDLLVLTCNGAELDILENMTSRPIIIRTKFYAHNAKHWEYYNKIVNWMKANGYQSNVLDTNQHRTFFDVEFIRA